MKKTTLLILLSILFLSCDKRKDFYYLENEKSDFSISHKLLNNHSYYSSTSIAENNIIDTVKIGNNYNLKLKFNKAEDFVDFSYNGILQLKVKDVDYTSTIKLETNEWIDLSLIIVNEGDYNISFVISDSYGKTREFKIKLIVFNNRTPVIDDWVIYTVGNLSPLHKRIVLTSKDPDEIYGGGISYFQYIINNDTTNYPDSSMDYIFPSAGYYDIAIRCKDNNDAWSNNIQLSSYYISD